jgi:hypothetical protein
MKLSDIELNEEEAAALRSWICAVVAWHQQALEERATEEERESLAARRAETLVEKAQTLAEKQGPIPGMLPAHQATAAYASWFDGAGYADVYDSDYEPDDSDQDLWETAYANRIAELRRARAS